MADYDAVFTQIWWGRAGEDVARRMVTTLTEIMEKPDHQCVLAVSHAGACMTFLGRWVDPMQVAARSALFQLCSASFYL